MPSRSPWGYQKRKRLRPTPLRPPNMGMDTGEFLVHKYPTEQTPHKLIASEGENDAPNRAILVQWSTSEEE